uniref:Uncharacterized protein n=1 Tax=Panagrolaimus superbus TaxID=310955 RepID=A0A914YW89_9BILA
MFVCFLVFTVAYHLVLWAILVGIGFPFFFYFSRPNYSGRPSYFGYGSLIGHYPKLNLMAPESAFNVKDDCIRIKFNPHDNATYQSFVNFYRTHESVTVYYNSNGTDCLNEGKLDDSKFCDAQITNPEEYGDECSRYFTDKDQFGFDGAGTPCFILKFNKILEYIPYINSSKNCANDPECCKNVRVEIICSHDGNGNETKIEVYPKKGVSICQWPYLRQSGYHSPMAMLQIKKMESKSSVTVTCYAKYDTEGLKDDPDDFTTGPHTLVFHIDPS